MACINKHQSTPSIVYIIAFFALDFAGYWVHRLQHITNFFWNGHIVHHSSEEFNLACALRQSISAIVKIFAIFLLPAALLGVPAQVIAVVAPLHLFAQFWYHTQHIGKMGFLEKIIVTPSHHRVHHAFNKEYIDKNYGQIFIFWDKWFGTFQEEMPDVPPVYGITRPVQNLEPDQNKFSARMVVDDRMPGEPKTGKINFLYGSSQPVSALLMLIEKYPVYKIEDVYHFEKYDTQTSTALNVWSWIQLLLILFFISYLFGNIALINSLDKTLYFFVWRLYFFKCVCIYRSDGQEPFCIVWEIIRVWYWPHILFNQNDWFGANTIYSMQ